MRFLVMSYIKVVPSSFICVQIIRRSRERETLVTTGAILESVNFNVISILRYGRVGRFPSRWRGDFSQRKYGSTEECWEYHRRIIWPTTFEQKMTRGLQRSSEVVKIWGYRTIKSITHLVTSLYRAFSFTCLPQTA